MSRTKGAKTGKYGANINKDQFEKLCSIFCTEEEICGFFNVSHDTLNRWCHQEYDCTFKQVFDQKNAIGKISLRRTQYKLAETNPTMAIWLGKQYLGQKEQLEQAIIVKEKTKTEELSDTLFGDE